MGIDDTPDRGNAPAQLFCDAQVVLPVIADSADVDLGRQPEIEDLRDDVGGLEIEGILGKEAGSSWRSFRTYSAVGRWPSFSDTRITPSFTPIVEPSLKARL
jgi:hypothetical protein